MLIRRAGDILEAPMMTPPEFETRCTAWLSDEKNASAEGFAGILAASFEVLGTFQRDLAVEFEVAESTVSRWAKGTARPHPRIQKQVIRSLQRRAGKIVPRTRANTSPGLGAPISLAAKPR